MKDNIMSTFAEYLQRMEARAAASTPETDAHHATRKINLQRTMRGLKTYVPGPEIREAMAHVDHRQTWIIIAEDWCGDGAQILPILASIASLSDKVTLDIVDRDRHLDLMDQYLTNGTRGIPKLIIRCEDGRDLATWGPRPAAAQAIVDEAKAAGLTKDEWHILLHSWYGRNRGVAIEEEILHLVDSLVCEPVGISA